MDRHDSTAGTESRSPGWVAVPALLYILAHFLAATHPERFWGVDSIVYRPVWFLVPLLAICPIVFLPGLRSALFDRLELSPLVVLVTLLTLSLVGVVLPSATQLLGDGQLRVRELTTGLWDADPRLNRSPLTFWMIHHAYSLLSNLMTAIDVYAWLSCLSGTAFVVLANTACKVFAESNAQRIVLFFALVTQGYVQLFAGYVESYPVLFPVMVGYLVLCESARRGRIAVYLPAATLGVLGALHFVTFAAFPALLWAAWSRPSEGAQKRTLSIISVAAAPAVTILILLVVGIEPVTVFHSDPGSHIIPVAGGLLKNHPYYLVSFSHLIEVLNQYALVAPAVMVCIAIIPLGFDRRNPTDILLLSAAVPLVAFTLLFNPAIGAFRDWDVFSLPALPLTIVSIRCLFRFYTDPRAVRSTSSMVLAVSLVHTLGWFAVSADAGASEKRFSHLVRTAGIAPLARAYGAESLAAYYRDSGRHEAALGAFEEASRYDPENGRFHVGRAYVLKVMGAWDSAEEALRQALAVTPERLEASVNLGRLYLDLERADEARAVLVEAVRKNPESHPVVHALGLVAYKQRDFASARDLFRRAVELDQRDVAYRIDLGTTHLALGDLAEAESVLRDAIDLDSTSVSARINLGAVYFGRGAFQSAAAAFRSVLSLDSLHTDAHMNLALTLIELNDSDEAIRHLDRVLELSPNDAEADRVRRLLKRPE